MMPSILVVEDKQLLAEDLVDRLQTFGYSTIFGPFPSAEEALFFLQQSLDKVDIAILDIHLQGEKNGIALAQEIKRRKSVPIIYLTQLEDDETISASSNTQPVAFLSKPFTNASLKHALLRARSAFQPDQKAKATKEELETLDDRIFIRNGRGKIQIKLDDILWIQSGGGETSAITTVDRFRAKKLPYTVGVNLNKLELRLSFCTSLVRCSRFYIINIKKVDRLWNANEKTKSKRFVEICGKEIVVGDKYRKNIMDRFHIV